MTSSGTQKPGVLFIISAPSGAGKSTLCRAVLNRFADLIYSVSYTTRSLRGGEKNGVDYHFIPKDEFEKGITQGRWAEWAEVHDHYYGTCADFLDGELNAGRDILLDIDIQGAGQILQRYPDSVTIFIMPPSLETLKARLQSRGTDSPEVIAVRLKNAQNEIAQKDIYRHIIINDRLTDAVAELIAIFERYRS
ncbi:MAG: guanylate kinase [Desulfobacteraceae bacterium]|jgi:guanylate kinase|nr:guanylate kinase [Desulfobacteraceae bacterium]